MSTVSIMLKMCNKNYEQTTKKFSIYFKNEQKIIYNNKITEEFKT